MRQLPGRRRKFALIFAIVFVDLTQLSTPSATNKSIYHCVRKRSSDSGRGNNGSHEYKYTNNICNISSSLRPQKVGRKTPAELTQTDAKFQRNCEENLREVKELALFAFTGCYGHDVMMREVGGEFDNFDEEFDYVNGGALNQGLANRNCHNSTRKSNDLLQNKQVAMQIGNQHTSKSASLWKITWVQILMYDFGFGAIEKPKHWRNVIMDRANDSEGRFIHDGNSLLWHTLVPFDNDQVWNLQGMIFLAKVLNRNNLLCSEFLKSQQFRRFLHSSKSKKLDLVVVDHLIQECFTIAASLLNAPTVQFSNWPICDRYVTPLNVPSNPSYVPITSTVFSGIVMSFMSRVRNTFVYIGFHVGRLIQSYIVAYVYASIGHPEIDMTRVEANHLFYAGRSELLFEVIRPISNRIKHFGCAYCKPPANYYIQKPVVESVSARNFDANNNNNNNNNTSIGITKASIGITNASIGTSSLNVKSLTKNYVVDNLYRNANFKNDTVGILPQQQRNSNSVYTIHKCCGDRLLLPLSNNRNLSVIVNLHAVDGDRHRMQHPRADYDGKLHFKNKLKNENKLKNNDDERTSIMVMEERYCRVSKEFPHFDLSVLEEKRFILVSFGSVAKVEFMPEVLLRIFLQNFGNSSFNVIWQTNSDTENVLKYASMTLPLNVHLYRWLPIRNLLAHRNIHYAILHGGINTINEVLMFGVPVLGVPLQGDQPSNLKRITELGLGELALVKDIWRGDLSTKMAQIETDYSRYAKRAQLIASMVNMYRFELRKADGNLQRFWLRYRGSVEHFAIVELAAMFTLIALCMIVISAK